MKIIVTGSKGQLGHDVIEELNKRGHIVIGVGREEMDITHLTDVEEVFTREKADIVIHCAAYTAVDAAEDNIETARTVNTGGTENIAYICSKLDMKMIYISTDYVFNGEGDKPWEPEDEQNPLNIYGQTKYEGELAVQKYLKDYYIVRVSWTYGLTGKNFVKTMLRLGKEKGEVKVVKDQIGSPTFTKDLSVLLADMAASDRYGIYHASNEGMCSWYEFACEIFKKADINVNVIPIDSNEFPVRAKRPKNSRMSKEKLKREGFSTLRPWQEALSEFLLLYLD